MTNRQNAEKLIGRVDGKLALSDSHKRDGAPQAAERARAEAGILASQANALATLALADEVKRAVAIIAAVTMLDFNAEQLNRFNGIMDRIDGPAT